MSDQPDSDEEDLEVTYEEVRAEILAGAKACADQESRYMQLLQRVDVWDKRYRDHVVELEQQIRRLKVRVRDLEAGTA
jgi:hypothetical protein